MLTKQRLYWERGAWAESSRWGNPGSLRCPVARSLRFHGTGLSFRVVSGRLSSRPVPGLAQGPSWWPPHPSAKMDPSAEGPGRLAVSSLLLLVKSSGQRHIPPSGLLL